MAVFCRPQLLSTAIVLALAAMPGARAAAIESAQQASLLAQSQDFPEEFRAHLFGVPLAVRVELDQQFLGEGQAIVSEDNHIQLITLEPGYDSPLSQADRERWLAALAAPTALGLCQSRCALGRVGLHYSLENSLLAISTEAGAETDQPQRIALPKGGSTGLMLRNDLAISAGQSQQTTLSYNVELHGSLGPWSTFGRYRFVHSDTAGDLNDHYLESLYGQRELGRHVMRAGLFDSLAASGMRQPVGRSGNGPLLGVALATSDTLLGDNGSPALYPIHVTAAGQSTVEILRDGHLLATQQVAAGIQPIDTRALPGGIYEIELRVVEGGQVRSRETAMVHKPNQWSDTSRRWRYAVHAGQRRWLPDAGNRNRGDTEFGAIVSHLVHPRAVVSAAFSQAGDARDTSLTLDWSASDRFSLYAALQDTHGAGRALEAQAIYRFGTGSLVFGHTQALGTTGDGTPLPWQDRSSLTWSQRLGTTSNLMLRASRASQGAPDLDVGFSRSQQLWGQPAHWRVSVYDREPFEGRGQGRNRGVDFTLNLELGREGRRVTGSLGERSRDGSHDLYARAGVSIEPAAAWLRQANADVSIDRHGLGLDLGASIEHPSLAGNVLLQRGTDGFVGGSLNLSSNVALGGGHLAVVRQDAASSNGAGVILDVQSDVPDAVLRAHDSHGTSVELRPGRNFVPLEAYREGMLQLDFDGRQAPSAVLQPFTLPYHLNKGGVMHAEVRVLQTLTVMGQVVDAAGTGVTGTHVLTPAGRTVTQDGGFFAVEAAAGALDIELRTADNSGCKLQLDPTEYPRERDVLMLGALACPAPSTDPAP